MSDPVADFLSARGCPVSVIDGGLGGLVSRWERLGDAIAAGYRLGLDDYRNDVDARQIIDAAWAVADEAGRAPLAPRLQAADARFRRLTRAMSRCLWGNAAARREGWDATRNWWYYTAPVELPASSELAVELGDLLAAPPPADVTR